MCVSPVLMLLFISVSLQRYQYVYFTVKHHKNTKFQNIYQTKNGRYFLRASFIQPLVNTIAIRSIILLSLSFFLSAFLFHLFSNILASIQYVCMCVWWILPKQIGSTIFNHTNIHNKRFWFLFSFSSCIEVNLYIYLW